MALPLQKQHSDAYKNQKRMMRRPGLYHRKWAHLLSSIMTGGNQSPVFSDLGVCLFTCLFICFRSRSHLLPTETNVCNIMLLKSEQWFCTLPELRWYPLAVPSPLHIEKERRLCTSSAKTSSVNHIGLPATKGPRSPQKHYPVLPMIPVRLGLGSSIFEMFHLLDKAYLSLSLS